MREKWQEALSSPYMLGPNIAEVGLTPAAALLSCAKDLLIEATSLKAHHLCLSQT